jgi:Fe-S-cluster containining protein
VKYISIDSEDIARFKSADREDLCTESMLVKWEYFGGKDLFRNINMMRCPFLKNVRDEENYFCSIYDVRPNVCRNFGEVTGREHSEKVCACPAWGGFKYIKSAEADQINHQIKLQGRSYEK